MTVITLVIVGKRSSELNPVLSDDHRKKERARPERIPREVEGSMTTTRRVGDLHRALQGTERSVRCEATPSGAITAMSTKLAVVRALCR